MLRRSARVLIVDDNSDVLSSMSLLLSAAGYHIGICEDPTVAIQLNEKQPADVLITDIFMPGADGLETITEFRSRWPALKIVAISGGGTLTRGDYLEVAVRLGADATLRKPFEPQALLDLVHQLVCP